MPAKRMSMPVNPVARPAPGMPSMRPGMHTRAPSMQVPGTRVTSGPRPTHRAVSGSVALPSSSGSAVRSPPLGPASPPHATGRPAPVRPMRPPMPGRPVVRRASAAPVVSSGEAAPPPTQPMSAPAVPPRPPTTMSPPSMARPSHTPVTSPLRAAPRASSAANRRRAYASAHAAAHSVSYPAPADAASTESDVFTPAALSGHVSTRSVSGVPATSTARLAPGGRAVSAGHAPVPAAGGSVPPVPMVPSEVPAPAAVPAGAAVPGASGPTTARVGNQLINAVVGAQPPNMSELDAPPPPIVLPPNATVTPSERANADPSYQRSTMNAIPSTNSLFLKSKLPLAIVLSPMRSVRPEEGDTPVPLVTDTVIARCRRCRTYINPFVTFVEGGQRWKCCMCGITNEVPQLFDWDAATNQPADRWKRPELNSGVVEFVAPREYMVRPPQPPVYVFVMDVSYAAVSSGMLATAASAILSALDAMPNKDHRTKVAFLAYDAQLHFFQLVPGRTEPTLLVVSDLDHVFLPQPNDLLVNLTECRAGVETLLRGLPAMYAQAAATPSALGAALQAAFKLCSASGGKLEVFSASLPSVGPGALKMRDDKKLYGGPRESTLLQAASPFYKSFSIECSRSQVSVDMWLFGPAYVDVATLSCLPRYTGGQTFYYPTYDAQHPENARKFAHELHGVLTSPISFEAVLRLRATRGIRTLSFHGNFFVRSSDLLALPSVPSDQSYMIECEVDEPLHVPFVVFQSVVLHSTADGERRIRVMSTALPTTTSLSEVYASADQVAIAAYLANKAVEKSIHARLDDARGLLRSRLTDILSAYRQTMTNTRGGNAAHLMLAQNLSLLPLLVLGLLRNRGLRMGTQIPSDVRAYNHTLLTTLPPQRLVPLLLPVLYSLHNMPADAGLLDMTTQTLVMPPRLSLSSERFERHGLYLIEDGMTVFLWLGRAAVPALTMDVFGAPDYAALRSGPIELPVLDNAMSRRVRAIVERVATQRRGVYLANVYLVKEDGDAGMRLLALSRMIEDRYEQTSGYLPFLGQLRDKLQSS